MKNINNQNNSQKRRGERALAQTTMQEVQASQQNQANSKFKVARENQTGFMKSLKPNDPKSLGPQSNNFMQNSNEFQKKDGSKQQSFKNGDTSAIMNQTIQKNGLKNGGQGEYPAFKNSASLKMQHGQKLMNMGSTFGNGSMPEI